MFETLKGGRVTPGRRGKWAAVEGRRAQILQGLMRRNGQESQVRWGAMAGSKYHRDTIYILKILKILITLAVLKGRTWNKARKEPSRQLGGCSYLSKRWW